MKIKKKLEESSIKNSSKPRKKRIPKLKKYSLKVKYNLDVLWKDIDQYIGKFVSIDPKGVVRYVSPNKEEIVKNSKYGEGSVFLPIEVIDHDHMLILKKASKCK